jgi:hypothetical protein
VLYCVGERCDVTVRNTQFVAGRALGVRDLKQPLRDFLAGVHVAVHFLNSVDRALKPLVGNNAMYVVLLIGRCGRRDVTPELSSARI